MDSAHNKVQVYIRVRPYAYDYEVDMEKNKEIKEGVKCIIQLRNVEEVNNNKIYIIDRDKLIYESSVENKNIIAQHIIKNTTS